MPSITLHPPARRTTASPTSTLPTLLQTPSGLALLEIQGTVNTQNLTTEDRTIGRLEFPLYDPSTSGPEDTAWQKRVYLFVGRHQRLTGEVKKLGKPLAVVRKREAGSGQGDEELEIVEIVKYKLLFTHRPEPVGSLGGEGKKEGEDV